VPPGTAKLNVQSFLDAKVSHPGDDQDNVRAITLLATNIWSAALSYRDFTVVDRGTWEADCCRAYSCEYDVVKEETLAPDIPVHGIMFLLLAGTGGAFANYLRAGVGEFPSGESKTLAQVVDTMRFMP
jgi:hypothetical protein